MPTIEDYAALVPFDLDELVAASNAILRDRPTLQIQARTVRFYISNGLLPSPSGGPKFARYGMEHLRRIVAIREWLDQGMSLDQAAELIKEGKHGGETETHQKKSSVRESDSGRMRQRDDGSSQIRSVFVLRLSFFARIEIDSKADLIRELERALVSIQREIQRLRDST